MSFGDDTLDPQNECDRQAEAALTKRDWAMLVSEFHRARGQSVYSISCGIGSTVALLRLRLMIEELAETAIIMQEGNGMEKLLDGLCDLLYVTVGTAVEYGLGNVLDAAFREVHRSNMTKDHNAIRAGLKYGPEGKGARYEPPNLKQFLK